MAYSTRYYTQAGTIRARVQSKTNPFDDPTQFKKMQEWVGGFVEVIRPTATGELNVWYAVNEDGRALGQLTNLALPYLLGPVVRVEEVWDE